MWPSSLSSSLLLPPRLDYNNNNSNTVLLAFMLHTGTKLVCTKMRNPRGRKIQFTLYATEQTEKYIFLYSSPYIELAQLFPDITVCIERNVRAERLHRVRVKLWDTTIIRTEDSARGAAKRTLIFTATSVSEKKSSASAEANLPISTQQDDSADEARNGDIYEAVFAGSDRN